MEASAVVYKHFVNIGVAVDTERGLLVPVVRNVDDKNIQELALELNQLSEAARSRKIRPDMLQGSTFTLTNLGGIGGRAFSPLINPPEVAVLGVSRSAEEPAWVDGHVEPRLMLPLSLTYDHRVIDGADAARFLRWVCEALGEPFLMDLEGE
jgi:pyruvate dehydrogenase E2 component (dihydrolipoamide acetyltransferase)